MRAIFYPFNEFKSGEEVFLEEEFVNHLNVVRCRSKDEIKLLNGKGGIVLAQILELKKNVVQLKILENNFVSKNPFSIKLALSCPKKDAFEDILRISTELGIDTIIPLSTQYSQYEYLESERTNKILESALIQSNNAYFPIIKTQTSFQQFVADVEESDESYFFFNSQKNLENKTNNNNQLNLLIGPEAGFSTEEVGKIRMCASFTEIHLPTPILRAPTAVSAGVGLLLGKYYEW